MKPVADARPSGQVTDKPPKRRKLAPVDPPAVPPAVPSPAPSSNLLPAEPDDGPRFERWAE